MVAKGITRLVIVGVFMAFGAVAGPGAQAPDSRGGTLPEGSGVEVLRARCISCHGSDLIESQRLSRDGWTRELDKMIRWGASVPESDRATLTAYLASNFAPAPAASHEPDSQGAAIFKRACLACHGADLTEQQRLTPTGWTREVEKMVHWGAAVSDSDKSALVDYLSARFPAR
jgi:mono/diheme cytochrome c family protein